jgi:excisionase family DNA binding protein
MKNNVAEVAGSDFLTTADAAKRLGYTIQHTRRLIISGKISAIRMGRDWLVVASTVDAFIARDEYLALPLTGLRRGSK